jgi:nicotinamidase-related amidase
MKRHILILIDCQVDFITGSLRNEDAIKKVPNIVDKINSRKWDFIFLTRDTHGEDYMDTPEGKKLPVPHCLKGTDGWQIEKSIMEAVVDSKAPYAIYNKYTFGLCSIADDLEYELGEKTDTDFEEDTVYVEFCGFDTDVCVVSNVMILKANWYDWADFVVDSACCAGVTPEKHEAALETMRSCQIDVI